MSKVDHSDCKTLNILSDMLNRLVKESNTKKSPLRNQKKPKGTQKKTKSELDVSNSKLDSWLTKRVDNLSPSSPISSMKRKEQDTDTSDNWLRKRKTLEPAESHKKTTANSKASNCQTNINSLKKTQKTPSKSSQRSNKTRKSPKTNKVDTKRSSSKAGGGTSSKQTNLNQYLTKVSNRKSLKRSDSSDSCELPTFSKLNRGSKVKKLTTTKKEQKALFKKYGVIVPTVDEILKDKEQLERDKNALELFKPMSEDSLEFDLFSEKTCKKENILDCKHLTEKQLSKQFKKNATFLNKIITGETRNQRHDRYHNKNTNVLTHSLRDLTYNTSTILFSFEQTEYLLELLKTKFDPDDTRTQYFFQVLLPELCLKIFMNVHKMEHDEAVKYLDERPISED